MNSSPERLNWNICVSRRWPIFAAENIVENIENNFFHQQVQHISQTSSSLEELWLTKESAEYWAHRSCGYICLLMWIKYFYWNISYDIENIDYDSSRSYDFFDFYKWEEKSYPFYTKKSWWLHYWLLQIARELWLYGFYKKFPTEKQDFVTKLVFSLKENYFVTASVNFKWSLDQDCKWSHLVVISWYDLDNNSLIVNDPYNDAISYLDIDEFLNKFNWTVFMIAEKPDEELLVSSPFTIEKDNEWKWDFTSIVPHQDELSALNFVKSLDDVETIVFSQNHERSIRFRVWDILLRVDPNRIYTQQWALKTILQLNKHIIDSSIQDIDSYIDKLVSWEIAMTKELSDALSVVDNIREYLVSKLDFSKPVVAIHNNRFLNVSKNFIRYDKYINQEMPKNCFVIVNKTYDFYLLQKFWINVVLIDGIEWDGWFSDFANIQSLRYFNIETWFNNQKEQARLFKLVSSII